MKTRMLCAVYFSSELRFWGGGRGFVLAFLNRGKHKILHLEIGSTSHTHRRRPCMRRSDLEIDLSVIMDKQLKRSFWSRVKII